MPFGRYRNAPLSEIPSDYLTWLSRIDLQPFLRMAVEEELRRRAAHVPAAAIAGMPARLRAAAAEIVRCGYRACALKAHPDQGGTDEAMRELVEARHWLESCLH